MDGSLCPRCKTFVPHDSATCPQCGFFVHLNVEQKESVAFHRWKAGMTITLVFTFIGVALFVYGLFHEGFNGVYTPIGLAIIGFCMIVYALIRLALWIIT